MEGHVEADRHHPVGGAGVAVELGPIGLVADVVEDAIAAVRVADNGAARLMRSGNMPHFIGSSRPNQPLQQTGPVARLFVLRRLARPAPLLNFIVRQRKEGIQP